MQPAYASRPPTINPGGGGWEWWTSNLRLWVVSLTINSAGLAYILALYAGKGFEAKLHCPPGLPGDEEDDRPGRFDPDYEDLTRYDVLDGAFLLLYPLGWICALVLMAMAFWTREQRWSVWQVLAAWLAAAVACAHVAGATALLARCADDPEAFRVVDKLGWEGVLAFRRPGNRVLDVGDTAAYIVAGVLISILLMGVAVNLWSTCMWQTDEGPASPRTNGTNGQRDTQFNCRCGFDLWFQLFVVLSFLDFVSDVLYMLTEDFHSKTLHAVGLLLLATPYLGYGWIISRMLSPTTGNATFEFGLFASIDCIGDSVREFWRIMTCSSGQTGAGSKPPKYDPIHQFAIFLFVGVPCAAMFYIYSWLWFAVVVIIGFLFFQCRVLALSRATRFIRVMAEDEMRPAESNGINGKTFNVIFLSEFFLEAIPQLALQVANNVLIGGSWSAIAVLSVALAAFMIYSCAYKIWGNVFRERKAWLEIEHGYGRLVDDSNVPRV